MPIGISVAWLSALIAAATVVPVLAGGPAPGDAQERGIPSEVSRAAAFGDPLPGLSVSQRQDFDAGFQVFIKEWTLSEGLGPSLNAKNCIACHGEPMPGGSGTAPRTFVIKLTEARGLPSSTTIFQRFYVKPDGALIPRPLPAVVTLRKTPPLFGLGLLEAVPVEDLLRYSELNQQGADRVGGRLLRIDDEYGRFGWNGNFATIDGFVSFALFAEMGLTSAKHPNKGDGQVARPDVNVNAEQIRLIAEYIRLLAPPPRRGDGASAAQGEELFQRAGCASCHRTSLRTGSTAGTPLGNRIIHPYTDLLVHDMGDIAGRWIRTAPLWGLASTGPPYLHDGRATTVAEAILLHGGEAAASVRAFNALAGAQQAVLLEFLKSL